jgi:hypothetical protein
MSRRIVGILWVVTLSACMPSCRSIAAIDPCGSARAVDRVVHAVDDELHKAYGLVCTGIPVPTPTITPTPTPSTATPRATPQPPPPDPASTATPHPTIPSTCVSAPQATPSFVREVRSAFAAYAAAHPDQYDNPGHLASPIYYNAFYDGVVVFLQAQGLAAWVDDCGGQGRCGEVAVSPGDSVIGGSFSDNYAVLVSDGTVRDPITKGGFMARCVPRWW